MYASVNHANISLDNGLSPGRRQDILWANDGRLDVRSTVGATALKTTYLMWVYWTWYSQMRQNTIFHLAIYIGYLTDLNFSTRKPTVLFIRIRAWYKTYTCLKQFTLNGDQLIQNYVNGCLSNHTHVPTCTHTLFALLCLGVVRHIGNDNILIGVASY